MNNIPVKAILLAVIVFIIGGLSACSCKIVNTGHVAVATYFGKVTGGVIEEGMHFPVNPLLSWTEYDTRQKQITENEVSVPTQDKLISLVDITIKYRLVGARAAEMLTGTGSEKAVISTHLIPKFRSLAREIGKGVQKSEMLFQEDVQQQVQLELLTRLREEVAPFGIEVQDALLRNIALPRIVQDGIDATIQRRQEGLKQEEELLRFTTEQQQKVAAASAELEAARMSAEMVRTLADARGYEIERLNAAVAGNQSYLQLEALKTLAAMSKDPSAKLFFINSDSPSPIPLMHIGDILKK